MNSAATASPPLTALRLGEMAFAVLSILLMSNALIGPLLDPLQKGGEANPVLRLMWLPLYFATFAAVLLRMRQLARFWLPAALFALIIAWAFASSAWSILPDVTSRRVVALAATTLLGLYLAANFSGREFAQLAAVSFLILALGSYAAALLYPTMGVHQDVNIGLWRGLWYEKNAMGGMMVFGGLSAIAAALTDPKRWPLWTTIFLLALGLILMSRSATSLLSLMLVMAGVAGLSMLRLHPAIGVATVWLGASLTVALGSILTLAPQVIFDLLGKDATLTGRTAIWEAVLRESRDSPWLGFGYAAFWDIRSDRANWIRERLQWVVPTAHNSWLDLLVQIGWIGALLVGAVFAAALLAAVVRHARVADGYWAILFLFVYLLQTGSESLLLAQNSLTWVFAVAAVARLLGPTPELATAPAARPAPEMLRRIGVRNVASSDGKIRPGVQVPVSA